MLEVAFQDGPMKGKRSIHTGFPREWPPRFGTKSMPCFECQPQKKALEEIGDFHKGPKVLATCREQGCKRHL